MAAESEKNRTQYSQFSAFGTSNRYAGIHALGGPPTPLMMSSLMSRAGCSTSLLKKDTHSDPRDDSSPAKQESGEQTNQVEALAASNGAAAVSYDINYEGMSFIALGC
jgi:hypothetical protein